MTERRCGIDFDGVLIERQGIPRDDDWKNNIPVEDAVDAVRFMFDLGIRPYVFTQRSRREWEDISRWLEIAGFPEMEVTNKKMPGTFMYVDDRCVRFTNWQDITKLLG